jgi:DNA helicase HerA-like ATPase
MSTIAVSSEERIPQTSESLIGHVIAVAGDRLGARLTPRDSQMSEPARPGLEECLVGQIGTQVSVRQRGLNLLAQIVRLREDEDGERIELLPLGEIGDDGHFQRGVSRYPVVGAEVHLIGTGQIDTLFSRFRQDGLDLGRLSNRPEVRAYFDPNALFGRHSAIIGQTGSGKSWTVASILQRAVRVMPRAHVILLDLHGEYHWQEDRRQHSAFTSDTVRHLDARELEIPYWLLTYAELVDLLIDRTDPNAGVQMAFLREVLFSLRKKANQALGLNRLSVDSPVYFAIKEMYLLFKKANEQQLDFGKTKGPLFGMFDEFLVRFQALFNDARYDFLFRPGKRINSASLEGLLRDFVGLGETPRQITVIDLSPVPADIRPLVSAQIGRLAFEFNFWNPRHREFPLLLVCEEAHQYIPRNSETQHQGTRRQMERIAKEGRKYGVSLCVVSQRPSELSETLLSQCSNFICMRMTNPDDQDYVRRMMPEGEQGLSATLSALRRGEALVIGEAAPLPTRMQVYPPDPAPAGSDIALAEQWREGPQDLDIGAIVERWWNQKR